MPRDFCFSVAACFCGGVRVLLSHCCGFGFVDFGVVEFADVDSVEFLLVLDSVLFA